MKDHRWSGWPGAWCLDCGTEDENETVLALGCTDTTHPRNEMDLCMVNHNKQCPEPGSNRHNPYERKE